MKIPEKPVKKYKNLLDFYKGYFYLSNTNFIKTIGTEYICHVCSGHGKIKDQSQWCTVEGLKDADWITCTKCNGTKTLTKYYYKEKYEEYLKTYRESLALYKKEMTLYSSIRKKLNKEELEFIDKVTK
jgi:hypothetical protein